MRHFATFLTLTGKSIIFIHKDIHSATWMPPDHITCNHLDHVLVATTKYTNIIDDMSYNGADCESNHSLVDSRAYCKEIIIQKEHYNFDNLKNLKTKKCHVSY